MHTKKRAYAVAMHGLGAGLSNRRETPPGNDAACWLRSLFAAHDLEAMARLDLPRWTLRSARLIDRFLAGRSEPRVFEYGCGASTIFLARRAAQVIAIEHDARRQARVAGAFAAFPNITLELVPTPPATASSGYWSRHPAWLGYDFRDYIHAIDRQQGLFDLIVVDGRCRAHCLNAAMRRVEVDGIILFDNAGRRRYRAALESCRLARLSTTGLTAGLPYPEPTVLLSPTAGVLTTLLDG